MNYGRLFFLLAAGSVAASGMLLARDGSRGESDNPTPLDATFLEARERDTQIRVWHQALAADSQSALALSQLAGLHAQRAREGGGWQSWLTAEQFARRSLKLRRSRNSKSAATLVTTLVAQHRFSEARDVALALVSDEPDVPQYRAILAEISLELGDDTLATTMFNTLWPSRQHLSIAPRLARWMELRGHVPVARHLLKEARDEALRRRDVPNETRAWFHLRYGELELRAGKPNSAEKAFRAGLALEPNDPRLLAALARLAFSRGKTADAILWGDMAIAGELDVATLALVGNAHALRGDDDAATGYYQSMQAQLAAWTGPYHRAWSIALLDRGLHVERILAEAMNELAWRRDIYAYDVAAWALHNSGRSHEAIAMMSGALRFNTPDAMLWFHDGIIARSVGATARAERSLKQALEINKYFQPVQSKLARAVLDSIARGK